MQIIKSAASSSKKVFRELSAWLTRLTKISQYLSPDEILAVEGLLKQAIVDLQAVRLEKSKRLEEKSQ